MQRRRTEALYRVAVAMLTGESDSHYGYELSRRARLRSGILYPILDRMLDDGWVTDAWELPGEETARRPRRYYTLTDLGRTELGGIADSARHDPRLADLFGFES